VSTILSIDLRRVTGETAETHLMDKVLAVQDMEASPTVIAALLRRAADDLDPPQRPHRLGHEGVPGARSVSPDLQRGLSPAEVEPEQGRSRTTTGGDGINT
jgi:hypothetical protein